MKMGTMAEWCRLASSAAPERSRLIRPWRERVPSGKRSRFQRSSSSLSTCSSSPLPPPSRAMGIVLKMQRDQARDAPVAVEVVGRGGHQGALAPFPRQRAQDRRRVQVAGVVGHENDGGVEPVEALAAADLAARVVAHEGVEDEALDRLAHRPRRTAAGPCDVELRAAAAELAPALGGDARAVLQLAGAAAYAFAQLFGGLPHDLGVPPPASGGFTSSPFSARFSQERARETSSGCCEAYYLRLSLAHHEGGARWRQPER